MALGSEKSADMKFLFPSKTELTWSKTEKETTIEVKLPAGVEVPPVLKAEPHSQHLEVKETGKKKKTNTLVFKEGWTNDTLSAVRQAFADKPDVIQLLDEKFAEEAEEDESETDDTGEA